MKFKSISTYIPSVSPKTVLVYDTEYGYQVVEWTFIADNVPWQFYKPEYSGGPWMDNVTHWCELPDPTELEK